MRVGQTSFVVFLSKLVGSAFGFVATIYFARELGAEVIGHYFLVVAIVAWLKMGGHLGVSQAVTKRISEGHERSAFFTAGLVFVLVLGAGLSIAVLLFRGLLREYVGAEVSHFIVLMLMAGLLGTFVRSSLEGDRLVHVAGILVPVNIGVRSTVQILLVIAGFSLAGLLVGWAVGAVVIVVIGLAILPVGLDRPTRQHFESLWGYAKFSWLGNLRARAYNDVDVLVLGALVPAAAVGVYAVAWSIANFLVLFGHALSDTLFPEISRADVENKETTVAMYIDDSLTFAGLFIIPGFVGGTILADRILRIYGPEFRRGSTVFAVLVLAVVFYTYKKQLLNALNAIDRPDLTFKINALFIVTNVVLNVVLILSFGFVGAAIATAASTGLGLVLAYFALLRLVPFSIPYEEIGRQWIAAGLMGVSIYAAHVFFSITSIINHNAAITVFLVTVGGGVYFLTLYGVSQRFRGAVIANAPLDVPETLR